MTGWDDVMVPNYGTPGLTLVKGEGLQVTDEDGNSYTDLLAGVAVNILGHAHPTITEAVTDQTNRLGHVSNLYQHPQGLRLATRLQEATYGHKVMFLNSGTEANEAALKAVRRHGHQTGRERGVILAFEGSFHGRTMGGLSLTGQPKHREGFGGLVPDILHLPWNDAAALEAAFQENTVIGVFVETIQGEGGVRPLDPDVAERLQALCNENDALLVLDEVQTGVGRTGTFWSHEQWDLKPDIVTAAKGLGGGMPIGACMVRSDLAPEMGPGSHGCTFGGHPVSCAAANAVLDTLDSESMLDHVVEMDRFITDLAEDHGLEARGRGLLWGFPVPDGTAGDVQKAMQEQGYLVGVAGQDVVRIAPPLIVDEDALRNAVAALAKAMPTVPA